MIFCNAIVIGTTRVPILYKRSIYKKASNENLKICKTEVTCFTTCKAQPNDCFTGQPGYIAMHMVGDQFVG